MGFAEEAESGSTSPSPRFDQDLLSSFDFRQLFYFCAVVDHLSFSRASESLHVAQPWLSAQVRRLEERAGRALVERSSPLRLTEAGAALYVRADRLLREAKSVAGTLKGIKERPSGELMPAEMDTPRCELTIYSLQMPIQATGLDVLTEFAADVEMRIDTTINHTGTVERVRLGLCDVALCLGPIAAGGLRRLLVHAEPLVVVMDAADPLAQRSTLTLRDLANRRVGAPPRSLHPQLYDHVYGAMQKSGTEVVSVPNTTMRNTLLAAAGGENLVLSPISSTVRLPDGLVSRPLGPRPIFIGVWWIMAEHTINRNAELLWKILQSRHHQPTQLGM
ncbi:LysR family transcriptional regulator [Microbacterium sp. No. 7]|uniref:LysR family transcriptional regulator n=1 Tax=Microbacterium sp. No. 7 TaxID=1714373 RepID=UPI0006D08AC3|nr:LysR family transcriptional regulator [Microbacterium sp. No. 7]ALJ18435.1 hypothetical protein AOA12_00275 [Microbacterium sp. No. 7]